MAWHPDWLKAYYRSEVWAKRRKAYYRRHKRQCAACGTWKRVQLHHVEYEGPWGNLRNRFDWGKEPDRALLPLCGKNALRQGCHGNVHRLEKQVNDLRRATEEIVSKGRARQWRRKQLRRLGKWVRRQMWSTPGVKSA